MTATISDFNLPKINTAEYEQHVRATIEYGGSLFAVGRRGSGKSLILRNIIEELGYQEVIWNLSTKDRTDVGGFPNLLSAKQNHKYVEYLYPDIFEPMLEGDRKIILNFEELDKSDPSLYGPLYEIVQSRSINGKKLKNIKAIFATGNLISEGGQKPSPPLLDRMEAYLVEASAILFLNWASKNNIHPSLCAYIADNQTDLFGEIDPGESYKDQSPRGYHRASEIITHGEARGWSNDFLTTKVAGCVGKQVGLKYAAYFKHYKVLLPIVDNIMAGKAYEEFDQLDKGMAITCAMLVGNRFARILDENQKTLFKLAQEKRFKEFPPQTSAVVKFFKSIDPEMQLIAVRSQIGQQRGIDAGLIYHPDFKEILDTLRKRING